MNVLYYVAAKINAEKNGIPEVGSSEVLVGVLDTVYYVAGIAAVIMIIIAGIQYVTSDGDSSKIAGAKNTILYSIIGLVVVISAFTITGFISGRF